MNTRFHAKGLLIGLLLLTLFVSCATPESPTPETTTKFPTGRFVHELAIWALEFDEDGTWRGFDGDVSVSIISGKYATNGNLWTEMTHDYPTSPKVPATYTWTYDGQRLTFQLWGEDVNPHRKSLLDGQTYLKAE
jgi:hypothetical protein